MSMHFGLVPHQEGKKNLYKNYYEVQIDIVSESCNLYLHLDLQQYYEVAS